MAFQSKLVSLMRLSTPDESSIWFSSNNLFYVAILMMSSVYDFLQLWRQLGEWLLILHLSVDNRWGPELWGWFLQRSPFSFRLSHLRCCRYDRLDWHWQFTRKKRIPSFSKIRLNVLLHFVHHYTSHCIVIHSFTFQLLRNSIITGAVNFMRESYF